MTTSEDRLQLWADEHNARRKAVTLALDYWSENYGLSAKSGLFSASVNKAFLEHSHVQSFMYYL